MSQSSSPESCHGMKGPSVRACPVTPPPLAYIIVSIDIITISTTIHLPPYPSSRLILRETSSTAFVTSTMDIRCKQPLHSSTAGRSPWSNSTMHSSHWSCDYWPDRIMLSYQPDLVNCLGKDK